MQVHMFTLECVNLNNQESRVGNRELQLMGEKGRSLRDEQPPFCVSSSVERENCVLNAGDTGTWKKPALRLVDCVKTGVS